MNSEGLGNQRDMAGNQVGSRDTAGSRDRGGASATRDMGGAVTRRQRRHARHGRRQQSRYAATAAPAAATTAALLREIRVRDLPPRLVAPAAAAPARARQQQSRRHVARRRWRWRRTSAMNGRTGKMRLTTLVLIASLATLTACDRKPQNFETPEAAVQALVEAAKSDRRPRVAQGTRKVGQADHRLGRRGRRQEWPRAISWRTTSTANSLDKSVDKFGHSRSGAGQMALPHSHRHEGRKVAFRHRSGCRGDHQPPSR